MIRIDVWANLTYDLLIESGIFVSHGQTVQRPVITRSCWRALPVVVSNRFADSCAGPGAPHAARAEVSAPRVAWTTRDRRRAGRRPARRRRRDSRRSRSRRRSRHPRGEPRGEGRHPRASASRRAPPRAPADPPRGRSAATTRDPRPRRYLARPNPPPPDPRHPATTSGRTSNRSDPSPR